MLGFTIADNGGVESIGFIILMTLTIGFILSFIICIVIGLPIHRLLYHFGLHAVWWYLLIATILSGAITLLLFGPTHILHVKGFDFILAINFVASGPVAAFAFWFFARPDIRKAAETAHKS